MKNLVFVIWVVLFPVSIQLADYIDFLAHGSVVNHYSDSSEMLAALVLMGVWIWVATLLYEPSAKVKETESD